MCYDFKEVTDELNFHHSCIRSNSLKKLTRERRSSLDWQIRMANLRSRTNHARPRKYARNLTPTLGTKDIVDQLLEEEEREDREREERERQEATMAEGGGGETRRKAELQNEEFNTRNVVNDKTKSADTFG